MTQSIGSTHQGGFTNVKDTLVLVALLCMLQPFSNNLLLSAHNPQIFSYFTAHFVHLNTIHLVFNAAALVLLPVILPRVPRSLFWLLVATLPVVISSLLVFMQQLVSIPVVSYVGLSGVLHGLYTFFCLYMLFDWLVYNFLCNEKNTAAARMPNFVYIQSALLLLIILVKVVYEYIYAPTQTANLINGVVVYAAHADGVLVALVCFVVYVIKTFIADCQE